MTHRHHLTTTLFCGLIVMAASVRGVAQDQNEPGPQEASPNGPNSPPPKAAAKDADRPLTAPFDEGKAKSAQLATARKLGKGSPVEKNSIEMELILIPAGNFQMGSQTSGTSGDLQVDVKLTKAFYLGKTEVTQRQWRTGMGTTPWKGKDAVLEWDNCPATYVSWDDAQAFCKKLSAKENSAYRLPTEAEWEFACRAGTTKRFSLGDDDGRLTDVAWFDRNTRDAGEKYAHEVGRKQPNPFGLCDMHGNVWEWCAVEYGDKLSGGTDPQLAAGRANMRRVIRGGGWNNSAAGCRAAFRSSNLPSAWGSDLGFRVVRNAGP